MFGTLLIANRGEIALRVAHTARRLGMRTIAVHSDADRDAPHLRACDDAVRIASYLDMAEILKAPGEAVHPGWTRTARVQFQLTDASPARSLARPSRLQQRPRARTRAGRRAATRPASFRA